MRPVVVVGLLLAPAACLRPPPCGADEVPEATPVAETPAGFGPYGHAHNDYENDRPLQDALDAGLYSVEVDVHQEGDDLVVKHLPWQPVEGTLQALYLDPLQAIVDDRGSVHGDGLPFVLWIDLKDGSVAATSALDALLRGYDMLTTFRAGGAADGPVTVVLTGDRDGKERLVETEEPRPFVRDDQSLSPDDPPADFAWRFYALSWAEHVGGLDDDAGDRIACLVDVARRNGRKLRFFGAPDDEASWRLQLDHGVDFVGSDRPADLGAFLDAYVPPQGPEEP